MSEMAATINIAIELAGFTLCFLGILLIILGTKLDRATARYFIYLFFSLIGAMLSNLVGLLTGGRPEFHRMMVVSNFSEYFFNYLLSFISARYLLYRTDEERRRKGLRTVILAVWVLQILLLVLSQFNHMYYYSNEMSQYVRGRLFWLSQMIGAIPSLINIFILLRDGGRLSRRERTVFWMYSVLPIGGLMLQPFIYGINFLFIAVILSAMVVFLSILQDQTERYYQKEREAAEMRAALMLRQIQPHFVFNALTSIRQLYRVDPDQGQAALDDFSSYLRGNMELIHAGGVSTFEKEMSHTRAYLNLEQRRFHNLRVLYDLEEKDFFLPALTVQPLVENAVRHGISKSSNGGTLTIRTRREQNTIVITILDDGVGFTPENVQGDLEAGLHIGILNVRERLEKAEGSLEIRSEPGRGTEAVIVLRKPFQRGA